MIIEGAPKIHILSGGCVYVYGTYRVCFLFPGYCTELCTVSIAFIHTSTVYAQSTDLWQRTPVAVSQVAVALLAAVTTLIAALHLARFGASSASTTVAVRSAEHIS